MSWPVAPQSRAVSVGSTKTTALLNDVVVGSGAYSLVRSILPICRIFSRVAASAMSSAML